MSESTDRIGAAQSFISTLTARGVTLTVILGAAGGLGYAMWDQRAALLPALIASPGALAGLGVALTLVLVGMVMLDLYARLEVRAEAAMRVHADALQEQVRMQNALINEQSNRIQLLTTDHTACQKQVSELAILIAKMQAKG